MAALANRIATFFLTTVLAFIVVVPAASASAESDALTLLNSARAEAGLAPVAMHSDLADDAAAWTRHMIETDTLSHNPNLASVTADWDKLGENVGVGGSVSELHSAFMESAGHRGNILGDYDYVGIAVIEESSGKVWTTVVFMKALNPVPAESVEEPTPYSEAQPSGTPSQPAAAPSTAPSSTASAQLANAPAVPVAASIASVQVGGPLPD